MSATAVPALDLKQMIYRKPSLVIRAAIHGLKTHRDRSDFIIDMHTFGSVGYNPLTGDNLCMGCLATCALQSLTNVELTTKNIMGTQNQAKAVGCEYMTVSRLETAVNDLRFDIPAQLYELCGISGEEAYRLLPATVGIGTELKRARQTEEQLDAAIEKLTAFATDLESRGF